nr:phosphoribosyltransferase family protein [uncultured Muribaculum sp.]
MYELRDGASVAGRHVLVVDDVITTGATLLACCEAIHRVEPSARLSVLALGVAHLS